VLDLGRALAVDFERLQFRRQRVELALFLERKLRFVRERAGGLGRRGK